MQDHHGPVLDVDAGAAANGKPHPARQAVSPLTKRLIAASTVLAIVLVLAARDVTAVTIWLYPLAWYPLLVVLDGLVVRWGGSSLVARPRELAAMLFWSAVVWFAFEALNTRLANWYYVYVPAVRWQRWIGTALAFATVVPAIVLPARLLERRRWFEHLVTRPFSIGALDLRLAFATGLVLLAALLAWPRLFYPLAWGAVWLLAEPLLYRLDPAHSLFADLEAGRWARAARIMAGGLVAGAFWESLNALARTRWIYTVPALEHVKIFEMPPLGFVGFPFFALEAWSLYHLLRRMTRWWTVVLASAGVLLTLHAMDRRTFASTLPWVRELPEITAADATRLENAGLGDAFRIARGGIAALEQAGFPRDQAVRLVGVAELAALRGIGTRNAAALAAAGWATVGQLATADPAAVWAAVRRGGAADRPTAAEVRVWIRAAQAGTSRSAL
jgi:hypothetical protein